MGCSLGHRALVHAYKKGIMHISAFTDICTNPTQRRHKCMLMALYLLMRLHNTQRDSTERKGTLTDLKNTLMLMFALLGHLLELY